MPIELSYKSEPWRFPSSHWVHTHTADGKELVTLTGIVAVDLQGNGDDWMRDRINMMVPFPTGIFPQPEAGIWHRIRGRAMGSFRHP